MNKKGIAIFTGELKKVQEQCSIFLNDSAFEILDIKFSITCVQHNLVCYSVMVYYNEIIDEKNIKIIKKTTYEIKDNTKHQAMEGLASLFG